MGFTDDGSYDQTRSMARKQKMESYGASRIVFMDSAGALTPKMVKNISDEILSVIDVPLGFHAHNNLHSAVANSLAAQASGCDSIDACARGYGAGAGNLSMEALIALLEKDGYSTGIDLKKLTELSGLIEKEFQNTLPIVDSLSTATGYYGVFSGFKPKIIERQKHSMSIQWISSNARRVSNCRSRGPDYCNSIKDGKGGIY